MTVMKMLLLEYIIVYGIYLIMVLNILKKEPSLSEKRGRLVKLYMEHWYGYLSIFILAYLTSITLNMTVHTQVTEGLIVELATCACLLILFLHALLICIPKLTPTKWVSRPYADWVKTQEAVDSHVRTVINKTKLSNSTAILALANITFFIILLNLE